MTELEAIGIRKSRRSYLNQPISPKNAEELRMLVQECNEQSGLRIQFVENGSSAFARFSKSYGMFSGVRSLFALVANQCDPHHLEKVGYFGERLVLRATMLGLGTCWVGGTFDSNACSCEVCEGEKIICVITVGNTAERIGAKEQVLYRLAHLKNTKLEQLYTATQAPPAWFMDGVMAVNQAPSAINRKPVRVRFDENRAVIGTESQDPTCYIDLGIAKYHFELAAGGRFACGNNAPFEKTER